MFKDIDNNVPGENRKANTFCSQVPGAIITKKM